MNAQEVQARWGLPDWTRPDSYPQHTTDAVWRWEFLRRRPVYRQRWEAVTTLYPTKKVDGICVVRDPRLGTLCDPRSAAIPHDAASWLEKIHRERRIEREIYFFSLEEAIGPQIEKARDELLRQQQKLYGKKNPDRPSRELWPLYLRLLDARECGASWNTIGKTLWGSGTAKDKARRTYESAIAVRDKFRI